MNRVLRTTAVLLLAAAPLGALADVQTPAVSGFTGVRLAVPGKMEVIQGNTESLSIEGAAEDLAKIEAVVENGVLHIRQKERLGNWSWNPRFRMTVNMKNVDQLSISGSGDITSNALRAGPIKLAISGSGNIRIPNLEADEAKVAISGSGDVSLAGRAGSVDSHISGSGDLKAEKLEARNVTVSISGAGDVKVWARETLKVRVAGSGDVRYYGDAKVQNSVAGSGRVRRLGATPG
jgi:hypothetical protein